MTEEGIDALLFLYREELGKSLRAHRLLGEMAWDDGRYKSALLHSCLTVLSLLSSGADVCRELFPDWRFDIDAAADALQPDRDVRYPESYDGVSRLLQKLAETSPRVMSRLESEGLWVQLYLLGSSLYAEGYVDSARSLWQVLVLRDEVEGVFLARPEAGLWSRLAVRQLGEPFISRGSLAP